MRRATVVGVDKYLHYPLLTGAVNDAISIQKVLAAIQYNVVGLHDNIQNEQFAPVKRNILRELDNMCKHSSPNDLVLFYFAGHGNRMTVPKPDGSVLKDHPVLFSAESHSLEPKSALAMYELEEIIASAPARSKIMIFDACYSGIHTREITESTSDPKRTTINFLKGYQFASGIAVIHATTATQKAHEIVLQEEHGFFTYNFLAAFKKVSHIGKIDLFSVIKLTAEEMALHNLNFDDQMMSYKIEGAGLMILSDKVDDPKAKEIIDKLPGFVETTATKLDDKQINEMALLNDYSSDCTDKIEDTVKILPTLIASFNHLNSIFFYPVLRLLEYSFKIANAFKTIVKQGNNEETTKGLNICWDLNTFILKTKVLVNYLQKSPDNAIVLDFWQLSSKSLQNQFIEVLGKFGSKIAIWNLTVNKLDLSSTLDIQSRKSVDIFWKDTIAGTSCDCNILKNIFGIKKQLDLEFGDVKSISYDERYSLIYLCNIPEKVARSGDTRSGETQSGNSLVHELNEVYTVDELIHDLTEQRLANLRILDIRTQRQTDINIKKRNIDKRAKEKLKVAAQYLKLEDISNCNETIASFKNLNTNDPSIVSAIKNEEADLAEKIERYTLQYGKYDSASANIEIKKLKKSEAEIFKELKTMRDDLNNYIEKGEDENGLEQSMNKNNSVEKELEIKIQNHYFQYIKSNINTRVQNCTTVTSNDKGLDMQQVESIKQFIVTELHSIDSKINVMTVNLAKQYLNYNNVHQLLYQVVDSMQ